MVNRKRKPGKSASIFLNGSYPRAHHEFYRRAIIQAAGKRTLIAVDGGMNLFLRLNLVPDLLIGDFDSASPRALKRFADCPRMAFPTGKDATDGELAVRYCLDNGFRDLRLFGAFDTKFESDQMLANLFLLKYIDDWAGAARLSIDAEIADHKQRIVLLNNREIKLDGRVGDPFSIIPLSDWARMTISGAKWELDNHRVRSGASLSLRNEFASRKVRIAVRGSTFLFLRQASGAFKVR